MAKKRTQYDLADPRLQFDYQYDEAEWSLNEAERGQPAYLIMRLHEGKKLTDGEIEFITKALCTARAAARPKHLNAKEKRWREHERIAEQVVALTRSGMKQEAAIRKMIKRGVGRRTIYAALKAYKGMMREAGFPIE